MGVKEYYLSHLNAASKHSTLATAQESSSIASAEQPVEQRLIVVAGVDAASAPEKLSIHIWRLLKSWFAYAVFLYRHRRILSAAIIMALASVLSGLILGDVTSMMVLVVCLPTLIAFLAHLKYWKSMTIDDSSYPVKWRIGFALFFAVAFSLSLGFMLGDAAKAMNAGGYTYSDQAAIMIFVICGVCALGLGAILFLFFRLMFLINADNKDGDGLPPTHHCGVRVNAAQPFLYGFKVAFVAIFFVVFVLGLLGVTGVINCQYLVICCSQRAFTHAHSSRILNPIRTSNTKKPISNSEPTVDTPLLPPHSPSDLQRIRIHDNARACGRFQSCLLFRQLLQG